MPKSAASQPLFLYSTTVSDVGTVRANNQDSSFAGEHLIAMCDGMGGHAGGDTASSIAIRSLAHIEQDDTGGNVETISRMMETSVMAAHDAIVGKAKRERKLAGKRTIDDDQQGRLRRGGGRRGSAGLAMRARRSCLRSASSSSRSTEHSW